MTNQESTVGRKPSSLRNLLLANRGLAILAIVALTLAGSLAPSRRAHSEERRFYIGTYTQGESEGIYTAKFDLQSGEISDIQLAAEAVEPSFLAIHPNQTFLYAVNETTEFQGQDNSGGVSAFEIVPESGKLKLLNQQPSLGGAPCHLVVDATGQHLLVANYGGGSVASFPIAQDGQLGPASSFHQHTGSSVDPRRQQGPHGHSINLDKNNRFAMAADLGLDKVLIYQFDSDSGKLTPNAPPSASVDPRAGPRHFDFHPNGKNAYVINEIAKTVTAFAFDAQQGTLTPIQTLSTLPADTEPVGSTADIHVHPSGKFLYGSNRGHDSIVVFAIDQETGQLTYVENESTQGQTPRNFAIDPTGHFLLAENQRSGTIVVLRINQDTGELEPTGHSAEVSSPVCIQFLTD